MLKRLLDSMSEYTPYFPLLPKYKLIGPCYVTSYEEVSEEALDEAGRTLEQMVSERSDVSDNLRAHGVITAIFSKTKTVYDLPYFSDLTDKPSAEGGLGGVVAYPVTGLSEKNLLKLSDDSFQRGQTPFGANVSVHELAHTIMNLGLGQQEIARIRFRWRDACAEGLWRGDWASTNYMEFFAELAQIYFNCQCGARTESHIGINGPEALRNYDHKSFSLINEIFRGTKDLR